MHGILHWVAGEGDHRCEDVILPPIALGDMTADTMYAAVEDQHSGRFGDAFSGGRWKGLIISADSAAANKRLMKFIAITFPHVCVCVVVKVLATPGRIASHSCWPAV